MDPLGQIQTMAYLVVQRMEQILSNDAMFKSPRLPKYMTYYCIGIIVSSG